MADILSLIPFAAAATLLVALIAAIVIAALAPVIDSAMRTDDYPGEEWRRALR